MAYQLVSPAQLPSCLPHKYQFAEDHAPIFYLHSEDRYRPTNLETFISHTYPAINNEFAHNGELEKGFEDLDDLNKLGQNKGEDVFLTSQDDVTKLNLSSRERSTWLEGARINAIGKAENARTGAIIVVEKGEGVVDVFYFIFWAYNDGGIVVGQNLGNHVGDWEHVMIRFKGGKPKKVWLSQHANGEAYTFKALEKDQKGQRPILYVAKGSHAIYARAGDVDYTIPNFNTTLPFILVDQCKAGQIFDPLLNSYVYQCCAKIKTECTMPGFFTPLDAFRKRPGWLYFNGRWGDQEYLPDDPRQKRLASFRKFVDGPTGPASKQLDRERVWPNTSHASGQIVRTSLDGSTRAKDQLKELWWRRFGGKKTAMKIKGEPKRLYVDGREAKARPSGKEQGFLVTETNEGTA